MDSLGPAILTALSFFNTLIGSLVLLAFMGILMIFSLILLSRSRKKQAAKATADASVMEPSIEPPLDESASAAIATKDEDITILAASSVTADAETAVEGGTPASGVAESTGDESDVEVVAPAGFSFFRRKKSSKSNAASADKNDAGEMPEVVETPALHAVEQEMLATRQLYLNGHISKDVYVAETRALYARAKTENPPS